MITTEDDVREQQHYIKTFRSAQEFWNAVLTQVLQIITNTNNMGSGKSESSFCKYFVTFFSQKND